MRGPHVEAAGLRRQEANLQERVGRQVARVGDEELDVVLQQSLDEQLPVADLHPDRDRRMLLLNRGQQRREEGGQGTVRRRRRRRPGGGPGRGPTTSLSARSA